MVLLSPILATNIHVNDAPNAPHDAIRMNARIVSHEYILAKNTKMNKAKEKETDRRLRLEKCAEVQRMAEWTRKKRNGNIHEK